MPVDESTLSYPNESIRSCADQAASDSAIANYTELDREDTIHEARLTAVQGVGPLLRKRLVDAFGDAKTVLGASSHQLSGVEGIGPATTRALGKAPSVEATVAMLTAAARFGIEPIRISSDAYPSSLREIYDPPAILYHRGTLEPTDQLAIAIVGTRRATRYGIRQAEAIATGLAHAGITVVSGLARGIDGVAHKAAIAAGGRTLAVMAGGLMKIYPPEHVRLADEVAANGALLAESPPNMPPMSGSFPQRNRIISGLSLGVVVIEAAERSGALITARHAAEQGRDAFAVPGPVDSAQSLGCCRLLQEGAKLVISVDDILEEIENHRATRPMLSEGYVAGVSSRSRSSVSTATSRQNATQSLRSTRGNPSHGNPLHGNHSYGNRTPDHSGTVPTVPVDQAPTRPMSADEQLLFSKIGREPISIDALVDATNLPVQRVLATISMLEATGDLHRVSGALVQRA